ncbi:glycosyltransferase family 2 protein [Laspinema olomoucense]|uniref:glycosyltransferase family 2 protein n=1 Tax=Laspinema olomoucense TaxID=3231600 RepID=UPI0021BA41C7|nr:glycosyltransferase [Laspinema sp. D3a]MCT7990060.1 glycosyltransferase [Laspinema sp. D3a]
MNKPFFSVVVPTYNRANLLGDTIESVLDQTFKDFELLVIDDGSTDETREIVTSFCNSANIRYIYQENKGQGVARNTAIKTATGEWVAFLDSDDLWLPDHLKGHYDLICSSEEKISWIHSGYLFFDDQGKKFPGCGRPLSGDVFPELIKAGNFVSMSTVKIKKCVIENYWFHENPNLPPSEDRELWIRISADYRLHYLPEVTCLMRMHSGKSTLNIERVKVASWIVVESLLQNQLISQRLLPYKKDLVAYHYFYLSIIYYREGMMAKSRLQLFQAISQNPKLAVSPKVIELFLKSLLGKTVSAKLREFNQSLQSLLMNWRYSFLDHTNES